MSIRRALSSMLIVALAASSMAFADHMLWLDDGGIDYADDALSSAYIGFDLRDDGDLVVRLGKEFFPGALTTTIDFDVPDLAVEDFFGNDVNATLANIRDVEVYGVNDDGAQAVYHNGLGVTLENARIASAMEDLQHAFATLGFDGTMAQCACENVHVMVLWRGDTTVRATFTQRAGNVLLRLQMI